MASPRIYITGAQGCPRLEQSRCAPSDDFLFVTLSVFGSVLRELAQCRGLPQPPRSYLVAFYDKPGRLGCVPILTLNPKGIFYIWNICGERKLSTVLYCFTLLSSLLFCPFTVYTGIVLLEISAMSVTNWWGRMISWGIHLLQMESQW